VWRPPTSKLSAKAAAAAAVTLTATATAAAAPAAGGKRVVPVDGDLAVRRARVQSAIAESKEGGWALFHYNVLAYLWKVVYGREVPARAAVAPAKLQKLLPHLTGDEAAATACVYHTFSAFA